MNYNFILQLIFSFTIFFGISKVNNVSKQQAATIPVQATLSDNPGNRQHDASTVWQLISFLTDGDPHSHHEHEDARFQCLYFDRIRRRPCGFSTRCVFVKLLLIILYSSILLLMMRQFSHSLQPVIYNNQQPSVHSSF
jgi:hypothetical protein